MLVETVKLGTTTIVNLQEPRLTADIATEFTNTVAEYIGERPEELIIDMSAVEFMDSSGLGSIMAIRKQAEGICKMKICSVGTVVMDILKLTRMNQVLDIYETADLASAA